MRRPAHSPTVISGRAVSRPLADPVEPHVDGHETRVAFLTPLDDATEVGGVAAQPSQLGDDQARGLAFG